MDDRAFDDLLRALQHTRSRRGALRAGLISTLVAGGLLGREPSATQAKVFTCAAGAHPCKSGNVTACCLPGEYCCHRKTDNPICTASKRDCAA